MGAPAFTWGNVKLRQDDIAKSVYLEALRTADKTGDYEPLLRFARS